MKLPYPPIEPPQSRVRFPDPRLVGRDVIAIGCNFDPAAVLGAYRRGIFPWPHGDGEDENGEPLVLWYSPNPRAIFPLEAPPHWSRSLRHTLRKHPFAITLDEAFEEVIRACGAERQDKGTWIIPELVQGYCALHELGWAHSVEVWENADSTSAATEGSADVLFARRPAPQRGQHQDGTSAAAPQRGQHQVEGRVLVGGIYGLAIGGMFSGESMFFRRTNASKIAFCSLVESLRSGGFRLFDVQVMNRHLESLGCIELPREKYLDKLAAALGGQARLRPHFSP